MSKDCGEGGKEGREEGRERGKSSPSRLQDSSLTVSNGLQMKAHINSLYISYLTQKSFETIIGRGRQNRDTCSYQLLLLASAKVNRLALLSISNKKSQAAILLRHMKKGIYSL